MPGVDPIVVVHRLYVDPHYKPIKQKKRTFSEEKGEAIRELLFPTLLANVLMVPKPNRMWWMCIDFTSINKACPKDCYPLPNIDRLVDSVYKVVDFLDAFRGYHQIFRAEEDMDKTALATEYDIYYWKAGAEDHEANLRESFENLRKNQLRLNLDNCVFGVTSEKFLGYMISQREIEPNPDNIAVVQAM
ncbi:hypothetical protein LIER_37105 [Lithospermum erythrorhizon]|uniref:Uncharacterized protein n=1 Tax=Lithospermum erythrorhizon TaxID=34254 RepID=A0AAV3PGV8_LITER